MANGAFQAGCRPDSQDLQASVIQASVLSVTFKEYDFASNPDIFTTVPAFPLIDEFKTFMNNRIILYYFHYVFKVARRTCSSNPSIINMYM